MRIDQSQLNSLHNLRDYNLPLPWQVSEWYLDRTGKGYRVVAVNGKTLQIEKQETKKNWLITVLKMISYITIIPFVVAYIARTSYRKQYQFENQSQEYSKAAAPAVDKPNDPPVPKQAVLPSQEAPKEEDYASRLPKRKSDGQVIEVGKWNFTSINSAIDSDIRKIIAYLMAKKIPACHEGCKALLDKFCKLYNENTYIIHEDVPVPKAADGQKIKDVFADIEKALKFNHANKCARQLAGIIMRKAGEIVVVLDKVYAETNAWPEASSENQEAVEFLKTVWEQQCKSVAAASSAISK